MALFFRCKRCAKAHEGICVDTHNGVPQLPETITAVRNGRGEWEFRCVSCVAEGEP